jgi:hypothetical protein
MAIKPHLFPNNYPFRARFPLVWLNFGRSFALSSSWMVVHLVVCLVVTWIVYEFVLVGAPVIAR